MRISNVDGQVSLFGQDSESGKTYREPSQVQEEKTFRRSLRRLSGLKNHTLMLLDLRTGAGNILGSYWEIYPPWLGPPGTLNTSECPRPVEGSSLSQILLDTVPSKYYLSRRACLGILKRAEARNKPLPPALETALMMQAGLIPPPDKETPKPPLAFHINQREETIDLGDVSGALMATTNMQMQTFVSQAAAFAVNQRDEVRDLHGIAGALGAQPGMKQQTFVAAAFSAGAGAAAGSISYREECAPTLKAAQSGNMMPAVLCLNDQGGNVMNCTEDVSGTLRAQEHGHQPLVFENHGIDSRYSGPLPVAPTMSARYGTGGNNIPLVAQGEGIHAGGGSIEQVVFARRRVDSFVESETASTESARQHKDATDLVLQYDDGPACYLIRRLVPMECERLQGFPDDWTGLPSASDSARYKALGNSVAIPCVEYLVQGIVRAIREGW